MNIMNNDRRECITIYSYIYLKLGNFSKNSYIF